jgi:hypothetical protein
MKAGRGELTCRERTPTTRRHLMVHCLKRGIEGEM